MGVLCTCESTCASVQHHVVWAFETLWVYNIVSECWCVHGGVYGRVKGAIWPLMREHVRVYGMGLLGNPVI